MTFKARGLYASSSKEPRRLRMGPWLALGGVLVVVLVVATAVSVLGNVGVDRGSHSDTYSDSQTVEIDNSTGGGVTLTRGGDQLRLDRTMRGTPLTEPEEDVHENGDGLQVKASCAGIPFFGGCAIDYEVAVPVGTSVTVDTSSGRISANDIDGELNLSSISGEVTVSDNSGDVSVETTSGKIDLADVEGALVVETISGRISASGSGQSLEANSTSGTVDVSGYSADTVVAESISGAVRVGGGFTSAEVSTVSGGIEVTAADAFDLLSLESISGSVNVRVPEGTYNVTGESVSGSRALEVDTSPNADARIDASTVSGSLTVSAG